MHGVASKDRWQPGSSLCATTGGGRSTSGRLRLSVAGCGRVFEQYYLPALRRSRDWTLVAACDPVPSRRGWVGSRVGVPAFASLSSLLATCSPDALLISSSPESHGPLAVEALQKGLHVLVEKPMTLTVEEAYSVLLTARGADRWVQVGFNRRFYRPYVEMRARLAKAPRGSLQAVQCEFRSGSTGWQAIGSHLGDEARGGGVLEDIGSHQIDLLCWLVNRPVTSVRAAYPVAVRRPTSVRFELRFDGGTVARCRALHNPAFRERIAIQLADQTLWADTAGVWEGPRLPHSWLHAYSELRHLSASLARRLTAEPNELALAFERQLAAFAAALRGEAGQITAADAASGLRSMQIIEACRQSLRHDGRWVAVAGEASQ